MRIVKSLNEVERCPKCLDQNNFSVQFTLIGRKYLLCEHCKEAIFEDEDTQYEPINVGKAPDNIDDTLMEVEYAVSDLTRYATTQHELEQMERIRDIFDELISVIRRMKQ